MEYMEEKVGWVKNYFVGFKNDSYRLPQLLDEGKLQWRTSLYIHP